jgi:TonB family protein
MTRVRNILLYAVVLAGGLCAFGQSIRKVVQRTTAEYPDIAANMNLHGAVRLKIWITPEGTVRRLEYVGGHPLLAESALKAVKNWKYEATGKETTQTVDVKF